MTSSFSNSSLAEVVLVATVAAGVASFVTSTTMTATNEKKEERSSSVCPFDATFLESGHTRVGNSESQAASIAKGWTMEDALDSVRQESDKASKMSPADVLQSLQKEKSRFF